MLTYEKKKSKKDNHEFLEITGFEGKIQNLVIPEVIEGCQVEAIGNHAFSGREDLLSVSLPRTIKTLYGFAFHNCRKLKKITLFDSLLDYYDGVTRQCDSLEEIEVTIENDWYEVVRNFLSDNDKTLRFLLHTKEGDVCLTFPGFVYDFNENTMARTIQFSIQGSGYAYRECVDRRSISYRQYDMLFKSSMIENSSISEDIAIGRLLYPHDLAEGFREKYEDYIKENSKPVLERLISTHESGASSNVTLEGLLRYRDSNGNMILTDDAINYALKLSTEKGLSAVSALIMNQQVNETPAASNTTFFL